MKADIKSAQVPIPITLLSGFLGAGKTTLLENILSGDHGLKIAVVINDMSTVNIDAALIQNHKITKKEEKLIQLQNGCICCTLRGDLLDELVTLAKSNEFQYIVIESTGISEPMQVAETFTTEFSELLLEGDNNMDQSERKVLQEIVKLGGLNKLTCLDTCVTVVDSLDFISNFETTDFLDDRFGENGQNEDERTITDLFVDQIEFSNVIIVNKKSLVKSKELKTIKKIIKSLNPVAKILTADYCRIDLKEILNTKSYEFEKASTSAGWLQSLNEMTMREGFGDDKQSKLAPKPETEEYGINNFVFQSRRPFHPERLYHLIRDKFLVIEQGIDNEEDNSNDLNLSDDDDESVNEEDNANEDQQISDLETEDLEDVSRTEIISNKRKSIFGPLLRSKGFFWLASRYIIRGEWSSAGAMMTLKGGIPWFAVTGPSMFPPEAQKLIAKDMEGEFGDRRNEIVFIGLNINKEKITHALNECLLTDEEMIEFKKIVKGQRNLFYVEKSLQKTYTDGFEDWIFFDDKDMEEVDKAIESKVQSHVGHNH